MDRYVAAMWQQRSTNQNKFISKHGLSNTHFVGYVKYIKTDAKIDILTLYDKSIYFKPTTLAARSKA
jgi:hypothetical protein